MKILTRTFLPICLLVVLLAAAAWSAPYKQGDVVEFRVESNGKVIGTQKATCAGQRDIEGETLQFFEMETQSVIERSGNTIDLDVTSEAGYRSNGLPRYYKYDLKILNATVNHEGRFTDRDYSGVNFRMGVKQPFNYQTKSWALLFDNSFALQWEIAMSSVGGNPGDSLALEVLIPQLSRALAVSVFVRPFESVEYDGQSYRARVLEINSLNQTLYLDESGRLLKAVDKTSGTSVFRQVPGQSAEIARESIWSLIFNRLPGYLLLLAIAVAWYFGLAMKEISRPQGWIAFAVTAGLYWLSLEVLMPIQNAYLAWMIDPRGGGNAYFTLFGSALIFALIEIAAIAVPILAFFLLKKLDNAKLAIAIGVAAGVGYGFMQAANLTQFDAQGAIVMKVDIVQKFALIGVCSACGALVALFLMKQRPAHYYLIPIGIKTLLNWTLVFMQKGALRLEAHAFISLLFAAIAVAIVLFYRRGAPVSKRTRKQIKTN